MKRYLLRHITTQAEWVQGFDSVDDAERIAEHLWNSEPGDQRIIDYGRPNCDGQGPAGGV